MSSETWQEIWGSLALLPWIAFVVAIVWFELLDLRERARVGRTGEQSPAPRSEKRVGRRPTTNP